MKSPEAVDALLAMTEDRTRLRRELASLAASHKRLLKMAKRAVYLSQGTCSCFANQSSAPCVACMACEAIKQALARATKPGAEDIRHSGGDTQELLDALDCLAGEVKACWGMAERELRDVVGNTNYQVVSEKLTIAFEAVAKATRKRTQETGR